MQEYNDLFIPNCNSNEYEATQIINVNNQAVKVPQTFDIYEYQFKIREVDLPNIAIIGFIMYLISKSKESNIAKVYISPEKPAPDLHSEEPEETPLALVIKQYLHLFNNSQQIVMKEFIKQMNSQRSTLGLYMKIFDDQIPIPKDWTIEQREAFAKECLERMVEHYDLILSK